MRLMLSRSIRHGDLGTLDELADLGDVRRHGDGAVLHAGALRVARRLAGARAGTLASIWSNLGILAGSIFYFVLSATGLGALLLASYDLFVTVKWLGAAYLVWLGIGAFFGKSSVFSVRPVEDGPGS